jgi:hypothetical protein
VNIDYILDILETYSSLIPLFFLLIKKPKKRRWIIILFIYIVSYIPLSAYSNFLQRQIRNNSCFYLLINIISFICFSLIIEGFIGKKQFQYVNKFAIVIVIVFSLFTRTWLDGSEIFNSKSFALTSFILICYCLYYYKLQLGNLQTLYIEKQESFWIVSGIFLYCSGNFLLFTSYSNLRGVYESFAYSYAWYLNDVMIFLMNIFFAKGIQCSWQK